MPDVSPDDPFELVIRWLRLERDRYQTSKWDYAEQDHEHALQGLDEDSWFWERGVLNYTGRVRLMGVTSPGGVQALLKLIATLVSIPEHLLREGDVGGLPEPGHPSGELRTWET